MALKIYLMVVTDLFKFIFLYALQGLLSPPTLNCWIFSDHDSCFPSSMTLLLLCLSFFVLFYPFLFYPHLFIGNVLLKCIIPILEIPVHLSSPDPSVAQKCSSFEPTTHLVSHKHTTFCLVIICVYSSLLLGILFLFLGAVVLKVWSPEPQH